MKLPIRVLLTAAVASATLAACSGTKTKPTTDNGGGGNNFININPDAMG